MGAIIIPGRNGPIAAGSAGPAPDSAAYTNFIATTTGLTAKYLAAYKALLDGMTDDGLFNSDGTTNYFDALYVFATKDVTTAALNLLATGSFNLTVGGSISFSADHGLTGDGAHEINTAFDPAVGSPKFTQNSAHISVWNLTSGTDLGAAIGYDAIKNAIFPKYTVDNNGYWRVNGNLPSVGAGTIADPRGLIHPNRSGASAIQYYQNGSSIGTDTTASVAPTSGGTFCLFSYGGMGFSSWQLASASIGASMDATKAGQYHTRLRAYMTAMSLP